MIGAGFGGVAVGARLARAGVPFVVLERGAGVGGVWRENVYPGAACDVPSHLYSFAGAPLGDGARKYGAQPEILAYLERAAAAAGVLPHVRPGHAVERAEWDEAAARWRLTVRRADGTAARLTARFVVAATGQLSRPADPALPGLDTFPGRVFHSARWDHAHDLAGRRVAVVGTGASAVQFVPAIAPRVAQLTVYQRSPAYVLPKPDRAYGPLERALYRRAPALVRASRAYLYGYHELRALPVTRRVGLGLVRRMWARHLRAQVPDPRLRALLTPDYPIGCKRVLLSNEWYPVFARPNVELVPHAVRAVRGRCVVAADGSERPADTLIFGTGFAATDFLAPMTVVGRGGRDLRAEWRAAGGAEAFLGVAVAGFPNLFILYGPNTNLGHNSIVYMLEAQADYVLAAVRHARALGPRAALAVRAEAQAAYGRALAARLGRTVWAGGCGSWYEAASGRNVTNWPGFTFEYRRRTRAFDPAPYEASA